MANLEICFARKEEAPTILQFLKELDEWTVQRVVSTSLDDFASQNPTVA